ncbi:MAG TPA: S-adenosylmethionine decarboxylase [Thermoanaerobaculia bacterium]|nr:S-adenosylmethionine decarboxylase [Thermoanaerobaculia bacterium]
MDTKSYGLHLMLDAYGAPPDKLGDIALLYRTLLDLPAMIGMRRVGLPQILEVSEDGIAGLSGFVFIMESHISIHTYSERGFVTADVYSCKDFEYDRAVAYIKEIFCFSTADIEVVERGRRFHEGKVVSQ